MFNLRFGLQYEGGDMVPSNRCGEIYRGDMASNRRLYMQGKRTDQACVICNHYTQGLTELEDKVSDDCS